MISYAPRITVHPDRYGADRSRQVPMVKWLILHTSEQSGAEDLNDAEDLARYMETPGDRPSSSGGFYGASYHGVTDTDRIIPCTADHLVAYAAGGANQYGLHLCIPVRIRARSTTDQDANVSRMEWLDAGSRPYIRQAAEWIVDKARLYRLPLRRITAEQMAAGSWGYCDHWTASRAFRKSDHTDVGPDFPWDVLAADIASIVNLPEPPQPPDHTGDPDMAKMNVINVRWNGYADVVTGFHTSAETLKLTGAIAGEVVVLPKPDATTLAKIERELGHPLTPI
jgi:hypothetical protein